MTSFILLAYVEAEQISKDEFQFQYTVRLYCWPHALILMFFCILPYKMMSSVMFIMFIMYLPDVVLPT